MDLSVFFLLKLGLHSPKPDSARSLFDAGSVLLGLITLLLYVGGTTLLTSISDGLWGPANGPAL